MTAQSPRSLGDALREALPAYEAPESLRSWAHAQVQLDSISTVRTARLRGARRFAYAAGLMLAATAGWMGERLVAAGSNRGGTESVLVASLVDAHVRSLMANHLTDVQSSDHHTVKPWFAGKVTFAPHVPELQTEGFPLVGGRVEFVAGHAAAALVYAHGPHTINLFIWPSAPTHDGPATAAYNGYALEHWSDRGFSYWAVTDAAPPELEAFERAYQARAAP
jgi:anti-sigma factor RsiW